MTVKKINSWIHKISQNLQTIQRSTSIYYNNFMHLFLDKLVDGIFIFLGVYVAFAFGQCQEDQRRKSELKFHIEQIMKDLSTEAPEETAPPFKFNRKIVENSETGEEECSIKLEALKTAGSIEVKNLERIYNTGLAQFLKEKKALAMLSLIAFNYQPKMNKANDIFFKTTSTELMNFINSYGEKFIFKKESCEFRSAQIKKSFEAMEEEFASKYFQVMLYSGVVGKMGYIALKKLEAEGFRIPESKEENWNFNFRIDEDYEKNKAKDEDEDEDEDEENSPKVPPTQQGNK